MLFEANRSLNMGIRSILKDSKNDIYTTIFFIAIFRKTFICNYFGTKRI